MAEGSSPYIPTNDELSDEVADILIDVSHSNTDWIPQASKRGNSGAIELIELNRTWPLRRSFEVFLDSISYLPVCPYVQPLTCFCSPL